MRDRSAREGTGLLTGNAMLGVIGDQSWGRDQTTTCQL